MNIRQVTISTLSDGFTLTGIGRREATELARRLEDALDDDTLREVKPIKWHDEWYVVALGQDVRVWTLRAVVDCLGRIEMRYPLAAELELLTALDRADPIAKSLYAHLDENE